MGIVRIVGGGDHCFNHGFTMSSGHSLLRSLGASPFFQRTRLGRVALSDGKAAKVSSSLPRHAGTRRDFQPACAEEMISALPVLKSSTATASVPASTTATN